ncbi:phenylalanine--tRNA ligase subunit beta [Candidatus Erwinia haradaeae]|uniref:Phenylalanine--tRNA ligase beta subunit n=1 Tax=Candidatus Erwinia haradaeae TaxID=1922217 RepID=A0A451D1U2_9GAMM|nr:phenylalanine--tRNA ligase subunit beta [Candidatus Erwinia haradaeae]VFP79577.1 Phenylalanine--tRNA ligase beta subunit [Candidatus Erwinia haradaeae]
MKFSECWLREWISPNIKSLDLYKSIDMAGLEVNNIESVSLPFYKVVVGEITQCVRHPYSNKFYLTKINIGMDRFLSIICSASNCRKGIKVAVATIGAILPNNNTIQVSLIKGELSEGVLCSFFELGIGIHKDRIIELPQEATLGADLYQYLKLDDNIIEISITANRADCFSIMGIARDISAVMDKPLYKIDIPSVRTNLSDKVLINIKAPKACPRYLWRVVKGVNVHSPLPIVMKEKLRRSGICSVNPILDIINYVLLELGQPIDVFDLQCIEGFVTIRQSHTGDVLFLLDNSEIILDSDTLVIADDKKILTMAGICGGKESSVSLKTKDLFLGAGFFNPCAIIGRSYRYNLHTSSSHRFERGVDPELLYPAMERATGLLLSICGGSAGAICDLTDNTALLSNNIFLSRKNLDRLIGYKIPDDIVNNILQRLGCKIISNIPQDQWEIAVPSWRFDLSIEVDLVEEIMRIYGYNNIPNIPTLASLVITKNSEKNFSIKRAKELLIDKGYQEVLTYSFVNPNIQVLLYPEKESLKILRPISAEMSVMRLSLWSGLLETVLYNQNRQQSRIRLFESGLCFIPDIKAPLGVRQELMLAGVISGNRYNKHWDQSHCEVDFYDLKGDLESLFEMMNQLDKIDFIAITHSALHPGQSAGLYLNKEYIGCIGVIHPMIEYKIGYRSRVIVFELLWDKISNCVLSYSSPISCFPVNCRDISMIVSETVSAREILKECRNLKEIHDIVDVTISDVYRGEKIIKGFKSLTITVTMQNITRTLEEKEISGIIANCVYVLKKKFNISLRV